MPKDGKKASDEGLYSDDHRKRVLRQLKVEGFSLETQVYEKLVQTDWQTKLGSHYWYIDRNLTAKERTDQYNADLQVYEHDNLKEIDVVATKLSHLRLGVFSGAILKLVIECKTRTAKKSAKAAENWVFYVEKDREDSSFQKDFGHLSLNEHSALTYLNSEYSDLNLFSDKIRDLLWRTSHHSLAKSPISSSSGKSIFKDKDSFYKACRQVVDAADFETLSMQWRTELGLYRRKTEKGKSLFYWRVYPIIVFDGPMWMLSYVKTKPLLKPLEMIEFQTIMHNRGYSIDVVRWDCFDKYMKKVEAELKRLESPHLVRKTK
ncbi:MAG: hypothetical protein ACXADD_14115 [Candidatus Thorarchaeota archaeon]|jgi:hypothetical protein